MKTYLSKVKMSFKTNWKVYTADWKARKHDRKIYLKDYLKAFFFTFIIIMIVIAALHFCGINMNQHLYYTLLGSITTSCVFITHPRNNNLSKKLIFSGIIIIILLNELFYFFQI